MDRAVSFGDPLMKRFLLFLAALALAAAARADLPAGAAIGALTVAGNHAFKDADLIRESALKTGDVYAPEAELVGARLVRSYYQRHGYLEADVSVSSEPAPGTLNIRFNVTEGPLYHFGEIKIEGLDALPRRIITLTSTFKPGDPYVRTKLFDMQSKLYGRGLFESVEIRATTTTTKTADVVVRVKERQLKWIKGGVGWGSEEHERLSLTLIHENLFHRAYHGEFTSTLSAIWREDRLDFINPFFFETHTEQRTSLSWRREIQPGYELERTRGETGLGRDLTRHTKGNVALRIDRNHVANVSPDVAATTPQVTDGRSVALGLNRDTSDDYFFPSKGTRDVLSYERFGDFLGGSIDMNRVVFDSTHYFPVYRKVVLATAFRSGYSQPYGSSEDIPVFERFFIGGANSVRGYAERSVGDRDSTDAPLGGKRRLGSSVELRFPLFWKFRGAAFVDGGQVSNRWATVAPHFWKFSAGGGIRLLTPVGPFRLDAGYKLNRDATDTELWRLHFSVGEAF